MTKIEDFALELEVIKRDSPSQIIVTSCHNQYG